MTQKTELETLVDDVKAQLAKKSFSAGLTPLALFEDFFLPVVEAHRAEIDEEIAVVADQEALLDLLGNGHTQVRDWLAFSVAIGHESGLISADGVPTEKMSPTLKALYAKLSTEFQAYEAAYLEHVGEES